MRPRRRNEILDLVSLDENPLGKLDMDNYLEFRLKVKCDLYLTQALHLNKRLTTLQITIYVLGGLATALSVLRMDAWIVMTVALNNFLSNWIAMYKLDERLIATNQAAISLNNSKNWWVTLSEGDKIKSANRDRLVMETEDVILRHSMGALAGLQDEKPDDEEEEEEG